MREDSLLSLWKWCSIIMFCIVIQHFLISVQNCEKDREMRNRKRGEGLTRTDMIAIDQQGEGEKVLYQTLKKQVVKEILVSDLILY
jgi:hypothetical protein